jgi:nucleotide-binding universal stress UspA family protein
MFKKILVPLDGSRFSVRALPYATELAQRFGAEVMLIQIVEPATPLIAPAAPGMESPVVTEAAMQQERIQNKRKISRARRYLSRKLREIAPEGVKAASHVEVGLPADSIMEVCQKEKIDLVVMTTHGRSGLKRALMGSVADKVIRESGHPVLVIRPRKARNETKFT